MERPRPDEDSPERPDTEPGGDPLRKPHNPNPMTSFGAPKVTPLDEGKKVEQGIEVKET